MSCCQVSVSFGHDKLSIWQYFNLYPYTSNLLLTMARNRRRKKPHRQAAATQADLKKHIKSLGLGSVEEYRRWCHNRGLGTGLQKSLLKFEQEQALASRLQGDSALADTRRRTRRPGNTITQLYRGEIQKGRLGADYLTKIRSIFKRLVEDTRTRRAFYDILMQAERYEDLMSCEPAILRLGAIEGNTYLDAFAELARRHENWIRSPREWRPDSHNARRQFSSLVRHLLTEYDVPTFMDAAWFQGQAVLARSEQDWFLHICRGQNIRTADVPVNLSKMMAHRFLEAPDGLTVREALRWAQVVGQGGSELLARAIIDSPIGSNFEHEDFWATVVLYFVNHPMLDAALVGPLIDYIIHRKYAPQEHILPGGRTELGPPPQPNFAVKGRSIDKLIAQMEDWHHQLAEIPEALEQDDQQVAEGTPRKRARRRNHEWSSTGIQSYKLEEAIGADGKAARTWTVQELLSVRELAAEGAELNHCVKSYAKSCRQGQVSIWSLQVVEDGKRTRVLTIAVDSASRKLNQIRGRFNMLPGQVKKSGHAAKLENREKRYLARSMEVLQKWMFREGLTKGC